MRTYRGTAQDPVILDPWHRIKEVHWGGGGVAIIEVTAAEIKAYEIAIETSNPDYGGSFDSFTGPEIHEDDYKATWAMQLNSSAPVESVVVEDALHPWVWDGRVTGAAGDDFSEDVANGTASFGYAPNVHLVGQQVKLNQLNPPFGSWQLGDVVEHTHPNGSTARYYSGYTAIAHGPQYDAFGEPFGDFDFSSTESYYWYRVTTRPEVRAAVLRKLYLVNFRTNFASAAELRDFFGHLDYPLTWDIKGYPPGTAFTLDIEGAHAVPIGGVPARYSAIGSVAGTHDGLIRRFTANGFSP